MTMKRTMIKLDIKNQMKRIFSIFPRERERKEKEKKEGEKSSLKSHR
jgi:hypothetical protein